MHSLPLVANHTEQNTVAIMQLSLEVKILADKVNYLIAENERIKAVGQYQNEVLTLQFQNTLLRLRFENRLPLLGK